MKLVVLLGGDGIAVPSFFLWNLDNREVEEFSASAGIFSPLFLPFIQNTDDLGLSILHAPAPTLQYCFKRDHFLLCNNCFRDNKQTKCILKF